MFGWLSEEIASIQTPRFHVIEGPAGAELRDAIVSASKAFPASYLEFVLKFGNAKLYRQSRCGYSIGVFAAPRSAKPLGSVALSQVGYHDSRAIYLGCIEPDNNWSVYKGQAGPARKVAEDLEEWLVGACDDARSAYPSEKWAQIVRGPVPFSENEKRIIETRRNFEWRVLEIDKSGDRVIEVRNGGSIPLPALTVGVRSTNGRLNGAVRLKVRHVRPGETAVVHAPCYKDIFQPEEIELFELPEPQPEDRDYYAEFNV